MTRLRPIGLLRRGGALVASLALLSAAHAAPPPAAPGAEADEPKSGQLDATQGEQATETAAVVDPLAPDASAPWRGSMLTYRNIASLVSLDEGAELTFNPYYAMSLTVQPRYWLSSNVFVHARIDATRELTDADDTTFEDETLLGDLSLGVGAWRFVTIPGVDVAVSGGLEVTLPTSKISQARTLTVGVTPSLALVKQFDVLSGLVLSYGGRVSKLFHEYTTAEREAPLISGCVGGACGTFLNVGVRNAEWRMTHSASVSLAATDWLLFDVSAASITDWLYSAAQDDRVSLVPQEPVDTRHLLFWGVEAGVRPIQPLTFALGLSTIHPELAPDSSRYAAFVNRFTNVYLDVRLDLGGIVAALSSDASDTAQSPRRETTSLPMEARR